MSRQSLTLPYIGREHFLRPPDMPQLLLEGYSIDEILQLPNSDMENIILSGEVVVFKAGSANILGKFRVENDCLLLELAHIDGGGEGALPSIASLANRYAQRESLQFVEWRVHAVHCANPNPKLRRVLVRKGFVVKTIDGVGECYWLRTAAA